MPPTCSPTASSCSTPTGTTTRCEEEDRLRGGKGEERGRHHWYHWISLRNNASNHDSVNNDSNSNNNADNVNIDNNEVDENETMTMSTQTTPTPTLKNR